jgi:hypothetical protein
MCSKYTFIIINNYFSNTTTTTNFTEIEDGKGEREIPCRSKQINMKNTEKVMTFGNRFCLVFSLTIYFMIFAAIKHKHLSLNNCYNRTRIAL